MAIDTVSIQISDAQNPGSSEFQTFYYPFLWSNDMADRHKTGLIGPNSKSVRNPVFLCSFKTFFSPVSKASFNNQQFETDTIIAL